MYRWGRLATALLSALALSTMVACGGGTPGSNPPPGGTGRIEGNLGPEANGATVRIEGTDLTSRVGPDGTFVVNGVPPGEYTVSVCNAGTGQGATVMVRVLPDDTTVIPPVDLAPTGQITGIVSAQLANGLPGAPIAGARVTARWTPLFYEYAADGSVPPGMVNEVNAAGGAPGRQADNNGDAVQPPRVATTDANGSFLIPGAVPGVYVVTVEADGFENGETGTWVEPGRTGTADVQLVRIDPDNASVSGIVTQTREGSPEPLAQVLVQLWPRFPWVGNGGTPPPPGPLDLNGIVKPGDDPWTVPPFFRAYSALSDEQGHYQITNVVPGDYTLAVFRFGYQSVQRDITLAAREQRVENVNLQYILTHVTGTIFGRLENGQVAPLAGVWVNGYTASIRPDEPPVAIFGATDPANGRQDRPGILPPIPPDGAAITDENGHYDVAVEAGHVYLNAWMDGYNSAFVELKVDAGGATGVDMILEPWTSPYPIDYGGGVDGGGGGAGGNEGDGGLGAAL
ncbi:MAG: carboxypeptidase regulatory-like domain-containing protein [Armatimonadetes bacterium]|nr:carboxypeptidase regulatory-like domain-containing protein [Armatimonadota bacterium]